MKTTTKPTDAEGLDVNWRENHVGTPSQVSVIENKDEAFNTFAQLIFPSRRRHLAQSHGLGTVVVATIRPQPDCIVEPQPDVHGRPICRHDIPRSGASRSRRGRTTAVPRTELSPSKQATFRAARRTFRLDLGLGGKQGSTLRRRISVESLQHLPAAAQGLKPLGLSQSPTGQWATVTNQATPTRFSVFFYPQGEGDPSCRNGGWESEPKRI